MIDYLVQFFSYLGLPQIVAVFCSLAIIIAGVVFFSWLTNYIAKQYVVKFLQKLTIKSRHNHLRLLTRHQVFQRASHLVPSVVIYFAAPLLLVEQLPVTAKIVFFIQEAVIIYTLFVAYLIVCALLNYGQAIYSNLAIAKRHPLRTYVQVVKIVLAIIVCIIAISLLLDRSPLALLTGLGAATAIVSLVFKDSIIGFISSLQMSSQDIIRIGDWIEMPSFGADGDVIDVSLNTVKVQNWDKTIVTIPSHAMLTHSVKNWRGMSESGGRRIKRSIHIDVHSIHFCTEQALPRYRKIQAISDYIDKKYVEIIDYNQQAGIDTVLPTNGRCLTNIGLFRAYVIHYLRQHPRIRKDMTFLVRQLAPTEHGLPIELYIFTDTTNWGEYETIQADIFDHILAAVPYFDLRVFQEFSDGQHFPFKGGRNVTTSQPSESVV